MTNVKCAECGLINWPDAVICKRCGSSLVHSTQPQPAVMTWYRVYCVLMTLLYLVFVAVGVFFIIAAPADRDMSAEEARLLGGIMFFMVLLWQSLPDRRIPAKQALGVGVWTGLDLYWSNECLLSAYHGTLLIHWIKPETKFYLGRT